MCLHNPNPTILIYPSEMQLLGLICKYIILFKATEKKVQQFFENFKMKSMDCYIPTF